LERALPPFSVFLSASVPFGIAVTTYDNDFLSTLATFQRCAMYYFHAAFCFAVSAETLSFSVVSFEA
jgi:hypothetical protein